jgi:hypothetical protein
MFVAQGNVEFKTKTINNTTEPQWNEVGVNNLRMRFEIFS